MKTLEQKVSEALDNPQTPQKRDLTRKGAEESKREFIRQQFIDSTGIRQIFERIGQVMNKKKLKHKIAFNESITIDPDQNISEDEDHFSLLWAPKPGSKKYEHYVIAVIWKNDATITIIGQEEKTMDPEEWDYENTLETAILDAIRTPGSLSRARGEWKKIHDAEKLRNETAAQSGQGGYSRDSG